MTKIFIFAHFSLNIHHYFLFFVTLKGFVSTLFRPNSKTNMNRDKIKYRDMIFLPYSPPLLVLWNSPLGSPKKKSAET